MDVHEGTATVREAMRFSAYLRQPASVPKEEKDAYVEEMIELLELHDLSEALVFSLNVEARKRLTIGVELASKPELLLFLDEPTSGLDAQRCVNNTNASSPRSNGFSAHGISFVSCASSLTRAKLFSARSTSLLPSFSKASTGCYSSSVVERLFTSARSARTPKLFATTSPGMVPSAHRT